MYSIVHSFYSFEGNYGSIGFFDWLYGTNEKFKKTVAYKRRRFISFTPADQLYPSEDGPYKVIKN